MSDETVLITKVTKLAKLLEDSIIVSAIQPGANKKALARLLGLQDSRVSSVAKIFPRRGKRDVQ
jgi:hypothetical protein